ncbi:AraC family transcriptional regulator [Paenibacillus psychroresistens]|uniref:AraC family transcriptional regulator n=1 Tax=Paenibacillus psychroresistens TaxID=1778678 RepID=A0A6B8RHV5_9BACL|nr:helix-turn-helix domain-containing protein [Paenibacillus psychroresistens]QGQ96041.1 AraC family transcriptional regulator [Paenibacillus psychroresistens]
MHRKWASFSPVYQRFLISYLIVLIIPLIAGYAAYRSSIDVAESSSIENSIMNLNLSKQILEQRLMEVRGFTKQLAINEELNQLIVDPKPFDPNNVYGVRRMQRNLANYSNTNDYLSNFFIYIKNYNLIITPSSVFVRPEHFYELNQFADMSFSNWKTNLLNKTHFNEIIPLRTYTRNDGNTAPRKSSSITFLQSLPINSFSNPQAMVSVVINEAKIGETLNKIVQQYGGWARITDNNGETIYSNGFEETGLNPTSEIPTGLAGDTSRFVNGKLLISIRSDLNGWLYTAGLPKEAFMDKARMIKRVTSTLLITASILGLLIGLLLAYRSSKPIHRLLTVFREQDYPNSSNSSNSNNEYDFLAGNITNLIVNNKLLEKELNDQLPLLRDAFIKRLLVGEFYSLREIEAVSSQIDIVVRGDQGYVALLKINGYGGMDSEDILQELSVARLIIKQALLEMDSDLLVTDLGSDKIAVVFPQVNEASIDIIHSSEAGLLKLLNSIYTQYLLSISIGMGSKYSVLYDMSRSFNEAQNALEYGLYIGADGITHYQDTIHETAMYYYPIEYEQRLLNTLKAGEYEEGRRIMALLFSRNFEERDLSYEMTQQFIIELKGTLLKSIEQRIFHNEALAEKIKNHVVHVHPMEGVAQHRLIFETFIREICDDIVKKESDIRNETVYAVFRHIKEHYPDPELTLYRIAEMVGKPEKYISQLFKEQTGEHLSEYLELVRIKKAAELLLENQLTIDEISLNVGYNSAHSFRRAFKRIKGISPSSFRQTLD